MDLDYQFLTGQFGPYPEDRIDQAAWLLAIFQSEDKKAYRALASLYAQGVVHIVDPLLLFRFHFCALIAGIKESEKPLRILFYHEEGDEGSREKVLDYFKTRANEGNPSALIFMGHLYSSGLDVAKSDEDAFSCYLKAAERGDAGAQLKIAEVFFEKGSYQKAREWYLEAAKQQKKTAFIRLSKIYKLGLGTEPDPEEGKRWYDKAVKRIVPKAQKNKKRPSLAAAKKFRKQHKKK